MHSILYLKDTFDMYLRNKPHNKRHNKVLDYLNFRIYVFLKDKTRVLFVH